MLNVKSIRKLVNSIAKEYSELCEISSKTLAQNPKYDKVRSKKPIFGDFYCPQLLYWIANDTVEKDCVCPKCGRHTKWNYTTHCYNTFCSRE